MKKEPKVFVPRIFTTILNTAFVLYAAAISLGVSRVINAEMEISKNTGASPEIRRALSSFGDDLVIFGGFFLFIYVVDILAYGMYVTIARDYHGGQGVSIVRALKEAVSHARTLLLIGIAATVLVGFFILFYLALGGLYISTQSPLFLLGALGVMMLAIVAFALVFFFAVPAAMVEGHGMKSAVIKSATMGMRHRGTVIKVNFLFVGMVFIAMVVVMLTEFKGFVAAGAIVLFVLGRVFQAVVYTYISIVNPSLYLSIEEAEE